MFVGGVGGVIDPSAKEPRRDKKALSDHQGEME